MVGNLHGRPPAPAGWLCRTTKLKQKLNARIEAGGVQFPGADRDQPWALPGRRAIRAGLCAAELSTGHQEVGKAAPQRVWVGQDHYLSWRKRSGHARPQIQW